MSRFRRAIHGVASSYVLLGATALYALASVPVALHYLDKERFGLWSVMGTLSSYLTLIDIGMSGAAARLLIDHKDDPKGGRYGSLIRTGWFVSLVQAAIIFVTGWCFAGRFGQLLDIPMGLQREFLQLVQWQCGVIAMIFATRILGLVLGAHQRMDWVNYAGVLGLLMNFAAQWLLFHFGFGVMSLVGGALAGAGLTITVQGLVCRFLKILPPLSVRGGGGWADFKELFYYGKNTFLIGVGTQLILSSQVIIITRLVGLEAAAVWSVGLKMFNMVSQIGWRISDMSQVALAEMMARGETDRLRDRYRSLAVINFSFTGWLAISFALCNSAFVFIWTHGKIQWPPLNDGLLAVWMITCAIVHCHASFVSVTKQFGFMPYVYFLEGAVFVTLSSALAHWGGLTAIILSSIFCSLTFTGAYGVWRVKGFFSLSFGEVAWNWLRPMGRMLMFYLPLAGITWWLASPLSEILRLSLGAGLAGSVGLGLFLRRGLPADFQNELLNRAPGAVKPLLKALF